MPSDKMKYIYHLPYLPRRDLMRILDHNNEWKELGGGHMQYDVDTLNEFARRQSPTDALLTDWGQKNHTIDELFILLSRMHHYRALEILLPYTNEKYHHLYKNGEVNMSKLLKSDGFAAMASPTGSAEKEINKQSYRESSGGFKEIADSCNLNLPGKENTIPSKLANFPISPSQGSTTPIAINQGELSRSDNNLPGFWDSPSAPRSPNPNPQHGVANGRRDSEGSAFSDASCASAMSSIPPIDERELAAATNQWTSASILGKGGFGTVYKGKWKNTEVAIKRMENKGLAGANLTNQLQQSMGELKILNIVRHDNILPLYGYSLDGDFPCLVYQFMPNGSLEDRLQCRQGTYPLNWKQRFNIARGTARGLQFLHTISGKPLIHGDIKSANILLDRNFEPKIGDFGLAREGPQTHYTHIKVTRVSGTRPYLPDEYLRNRKISTKVDTYSFGIVLFELGTGQRAYEITRESQYLKDYVKEHSEKLEDIWDKKALPYDVSLYEPLMHWGLACAADNPKDRPGMVKVSQEFDRLASRAELVGAESLFSTPPSLWQNQAFRQGTQASPREKVVPVLHALPDQWQKAPTLDPQPVFEFNAAVNVNLIAGINQGYPSPVLQQTLPMPINQTDPVQEVIPDLDQLMINSAACSMPSNQMPRLDSLLNASSASEIAESFRSDVSNSRFSVSSESNSEYMAANASTIEDIQPRSRPCSVTAQKEIPFFGRN